MELFKKKPSIHKLLKNKIFFNDYHQLKYALKTTRLIPYDFMIQRIQPKLKIENTKKQKSHSLENLSHPASQLDYILQEGQLQFEKNKEIFQNYKNSNDSFVKHYKLLVKNNSARNNLKSNNYKDKEIKSKKEKIDNLFKSTGILLKEPNDLYFYYLYSSKNKKIKLSKEKSIKYLEKIKGFLIKDSSKISYENESNNMNSINESEKSSLNEDSKSIIQKNQELQYFISKTKQTLKSISENKNYLDDFSSRKTPKLNRTSSTNFFSPNATYINYYNSLQNKVGKKKLNIPLKINKNILNKDLENISLPKKSRKSSLDSLSNIMYKKSNSESLFSTKIKNANLTPKNKIEFCFEKIKSNPKLNKDEINNIGDLLYDNKIPFDSKGSINSFQFYKSIKNTQDKINEFNIKNSIRKIYVHKIPNNTKKKFKELDELENKIQYFKGKLYKSALEVP